MQQGDTGVMVSLYPGGSEVSLNSIGIRVVGLGSDKAARSH